MDLILLYINETYSPEIIEQFTTAFEIFAKGDYTEHEADLTELIMSADVMTPEELQDNVYETFKDHLRFLIKTCSVIITEEDVPFAVLLDFALTLQQIEEMDEVSGVVDLINQQSVNEIERFASIVELVTGRAIEESAQYIEDVSPTLFEAMMRLFEQFGKLAEVENVEKPEVDIKDIATKLFAINTPPPVEFSVLNLVEDGLLIGLKYEFYDSYLAPLTHIDAENEEDIAKALVSLAVISSDARTNTVSFLEDVLLHTTFDDLKRGRILSRIRELFIRASAANPLVANMSTGTKL